MCPSLIPPNIADACPRPVRPSPDLWLRMLWRVSRPLRSRSKPDGFILPCQPALADRPPSGPGWLHEIKFDGYRVIARKDSRFGSSGSVDGAGRHGGSRMRAGARAPTSAATCLEPSSWPTAARGLPASWPTSFQALAPTADTDAPHEDASTVIEREADGD
jgi:hypothetical protein